MRTVPLWSLLLKGVQLREASRKYWFDHACLLESQSFVCHPHRQSTTQVSSTALMQVQQASAFPRKMLLRTDQNHYHGKQHPQDSCLLSTGETYRQPVVTIL